MKKLPLTATAFLLAGLGMGAWLFRPSGPMPAEHGGSQDNPSDAGGIAIDPTMVQDTGVRVEEVKVRPLSKVIRTVGSITYDERKLYNVNLKLTGWVHRLYVNFTGQQVRRGEPLLDIYSPELVTTQEEYLLALRYRSTLQASSIEEARAQAEHLVQSTRRRLRFWDIADQEIARLERRGEPSKTLTLYSPANGVVVEKPVLPGAQVQPGMTLLKIADLADVWIYAEVFQYEMDWVKEGQEAEIDLSYLPGHTLRGRVDYIQPVLNLESRTLKLRIQVSQLGNQVLLRPDMFATVRIRSPVLYEGVAVPEQAIIHSGERNIAIIALGKGYFEPREVKLGVTAEGYVAILEGIRPGETIVTSSQFLIDSESNLQAALGAMGMPGMPGMSMGGGARAGPDAGMAMPADGGAMPGMLMDEPDGGRP